MLLTRVSGVNFLSKVGGGGGGAKCLMAMSTQQGGYMRATNLYYYYYYYYINYKPCFIEFVCEIVSFCKGYKIVPYISTHVHASFIFQIPLHRTAVL